MINTDIYINELSNIIRTVDGNHDLGAGELAEKIIETGFLQRVIDDAEADRIARRKV